MTLMLFLLIGATRLDAQPSRATGRDFSGVNELWRVVDSLTRNREPSDAQWQPLLTMPGYQMAQAPRVSGFTEPIVAFAVFRDDGTRSRQPPRSPARLRVRRRPLPPHEPHHEYMARTIQQRFGIASLFPSIANPAALLRTYSAAEAAAVTPHRSRPPHRA
jgi:hypothetical protein